MKKSIGIGVGIIFVIIIALLGGQRTDDTPRQSGVVVGSATVQRVKGATTRAPQILNDVVVDGTISAGLSITLYDVYLTKAGFVTIHESFKQKPALIIGVSPLLQPGLYDELVITLDRKIVTGERLYAFIAHDNGNQEFDATLDQRAIVQGAEVRAQFITE